MDKNELIRDWQFVRSETLEILNMLDDDKLAFCPSGDRWQPVSYQFACIARTQMVYAGALQSGTMDFAAFGDPSLPRKQDLRTKAELQKVLADAEALWQTAIKSGALTVAWPGVSRSAASHVYRLASHERIHHGQLISYFTLAGWDLPEQFKRNWAL